MEPAFVLLVAATSGGKSTGDGTTRLGITMSRRVGRAVVRNRLKRHVREWFRRSRRCLLGGMDLVVIGRSGAAQLSDTEIEGVLCRLARRVGAVKG